MAYEIRASILLLSFFAALLRTHAFSISTLTIERNYLEIVNEDSLNHDFLIGPPAVAMAAP
jgi:hypothetical protein